ncbi:hypothetical protein [Polaromonas sp. CG9_12]|nr:hypothetical protein [Polaromonas sp. CG9_12]
MLLSQHWKSEKINKNSARAIEQERFSASPHKIFLRGLLQGHRKVAFFCLLIAAIPATLFHTGSTHSLE